MTKQLGFAEAFVAPGFGRNHRLEAITGLIDWAPLERLLSPLRVAAVGRPPYAPVAMFKVLLLQQWYGLSDPGMEEALCDRASFRFFAGFSLSDAVPDETTICRFRNDLAAAAGLAEALFAEVNRQLDAKGFILKRGTMLDATIVPAQARRPNVEEVGKGGRSPVDPDADWTRKGGRSYFGYRAHVGVDQDSWLIRSARFKPASVNESRVAEDLIIGDESAVYADKGYESKARRRALKARGIKDRIMHKRHRNLRELPRWQKLRNKLIAPIRAPAEHVFGTLKRGYGYWRTRYYNLKRNAAHFLILAAAYNLRTAIRIAR